MMLALRSALLLAGVVAASPLAQQLPFQPSPDEVESTTAYQNPFSTFSAHHLRLLKEHVESYTEPRLLRVWHDGVEDPESHWSTEGEKALLRIRGVHFVDITDHQELWEGQAVFAAEEKHVFPDTLASSASELAPFFKDISTSRMKERLTTFSGFRTRYYRSADGKRSQQWLLDQVREVAKRSKAAKITVEEFKHDWGQNSIIAKVHRPDHLKGEGQVVIISAHQDSTNLLPFLAAPGADDDGSGTTTILETLTSLVANDFAPSNHTLEFHWYSAEEGGLLGSQAVATAYKARGQKVRAMIQLDMTAVVKPGTEERIGIIQDFVNPELTKFLERLVDEYTDLSPVRTQCGYACSDHASWGKIGAPSSFAIESSFEDSSHAIHSGSDTITQPGFSFDHMAQFSRLAVGFAVELAGRA